MRTHLSTEHVFSKQWVRCYAHINCSSQHVHTKQKKVTMIVMANTIIEPSCTSLRKKHYLLINTLQCNIKNRVNTSYC